MAPYTVIIQITDKTIYDIVGKTGYKPYISAGDVIIKNEVWDTTLSRGSLNNGVFSQSSITTSLTTEIDVLQPRSHRSGSTR
jgi:hypothetical protein